MKKVITILGLTLVIISCNKEEKTVKSIIVPIAKEELLKTLKAPSTAVFNDAKTKCFKGDINKDGQDEIIIDLNVDAQNSFGAMLNKKYTIVYDWNGKDSLNIENYTFKQMF